MMATDKNIGAVVLAAGGSSRMGSPKQLLLMEGKNLLEHAICVAADSLAGPVVVVLGAQADNIKKNIDSQHAHFSINVAWQEGIASSIRSGIKRLLELDPAIEGALILVCDQPFISRQLFESLVTAYHQSEKRIIASKYENSLGVPALFDSSLFPALLQLTGDRGAKSIIQEHIRDVAVVDFPGGAVDIDTLEEYEALGKSNRLS